MTLTPQEIATMRATSILAGARMFWALADEICALYGVTVADLQAKGRGTLLANEARQFLALYAMRRGASSVQVGKWLGGRDHSTILHAAEQAEIKETLASKADQVLE